MSFSGFNPAMMQGAAGGMIGSGLGRLFGDYTNPSEAAQPYFEQIPGTLEKYLSPYIKTGMETLPGLNTQYDKLTNDPGARLNEIGASYHQSPGFQFALEKALQGANHAAAAGGMAGSPQHEYQNMQVATNLANQDYNQFLGNALGLYGTGIQGKQGLYNTGAATGMGMGEDLASYLANRAKLAYEGANTENQDEGGMWGSLLGGVGTLLAFSNSSFKEKISTPSTEEILNNVRDLSLDKWRYKGIDQEFIGPYAEEFKERFGIGDGKTINLIDTVGILMGAIKELDKRVSDLQRGI